MYKDRMEMLVKKYWMGADPGGKGNFGLAFLDTTGKRLRCATVSSVDEAVELITSTGIPLGLGIDAPMWWSSCEGAGRKVDESIREKYGIHPGTVSIGELPQGCRSCRRSDAGLPNKAEVS